MADDLLGDDVLNRAWYVRENDLIGGWCVMPVDLPPSSGVYEVADFVSRSVAEHIVELHNTWVATRSP